MLAMALLFTALPAAVPVMAVSAGTTAIVSQKVNNMENPIGIDSAAPVFSWQMQSTLVGQKQTAYQIVVKNCANNNAVVWDTGRVASAVSQGVAYTGAALQPQTRYSWQVTVWDKNGSPYDSGSATFETGLMAIKNDTSNEITTFTIDLDYTITSGVFGLVFDETDTNNFYMWQIDAGSVSLRPHQWSNGGISVQQAASLSSVFSSSSAMLNTQAHLQVAVKDGTVRTSINGTLVDTRTLVSVSLGNIGFREMGGESAVVDNVVVKGADGSVLRQYGFSDASSSGFTGGSVVGGKLQLPSGSGVVLEKTGVLPADQQTSFDINLDYTIKSEALGFLFGAKDLNNFYMWQLNANSCTLRPHQWSGGGVSVLSQTSLSSVYSSGNAMLNNPSHLKISVVNGTIKTYINSTLVDTRTVPSFALGKIGFRQIQDANTDESASVDNIVITDPNGNKLFEDHFDNGRNLNFPSGTVSADGQLQVSNCLMLQNVTESPEGWSGAQWVGAPGIAVTASAVPVYELVYNMALQQGSTRAGALLCANDPRLQDKTKNDYRVQGENYVYVELDASGLTDSDPSTGAMVRVYRKGFCKDDYTKTDNTTLLASFTLSSMTASNMYASNSYRIESYGGGLNIFVGSQQVGSVIINPTQKTQDVTCFTYLNNIGFKAPAGSAAVFTGFAVKNYDQPQTEIFGQNTGATYTIFNGKTGVTAGQDGSISVTGGTAGVVCYADPSYHSAPMLRKEITASKNITSARLYVTARGIYEFYINGQRVGNDWFNPGYTQYNKTITYSAYDVTSLFHTGENAVGAQLASGWWSDQMSFSLSYYNTWGDTQSLLAKIDLTYDDGTKETVVTDPGWKSYSQGPVTYAAYFNGEHYDATREAAVSGWNEPGYDDSAWENAVVQAPKSQNANPNIVARADMPVRVLETLNAAYLKQTDPGVFVYDMGVNMAGVPQIKLPQGTAGQKITIRYAETFYPDLPASNPYNYGELAGKILTENLRAAQCTDTYIMKGTPGGETYTPRFTFHGYRYIEISGFDSPLPAENIKGLVLSSVSGATTSYDSSNPLTNQLFKNIQRSLYGNHISIPTDCPQRDERMGWTGDAEVFSRTATYFADMNNLYTGWEGTIEDVQTGQGWVPDVAPNVGFGIGGPTVAWGTAADIIPVWECFKQYGNTALIASHYSSMKAALDALAADPLSSGSYLTQGTSLADHLALAPTDNPLCSNVLYVYMLHDFAQMAAAVGKTDVAQEYGTRYENAKTEWNRVFINAATGQTQNAVGTLQDTQTSYALAIEYNVISDQNRAKAAQCLTAACARGYNNVPDTITTGFIGTPTVLAALTRTGSVGEAYKMFEQTNYPSWLYPVTQGATSIWERWNGYTTDNGFSGNNGMNSFNHYAYGAVGAWMTNYQVGIISDETAPGFQHFILQPTPGGDFTYTNGGYDSVYGHIESDWTANAGSLTSYTAQVPANTTATLYLPVGSGKSVQVNTPGVTFTGMASRNGQECAVFTLETGGFRFDVSSDRVTVALGSGYVTDTAANTQTVLANLTLNKTATATCSDKAYPASNAVDGSDTTRWSSIDVSRPTTDWNNASVTVDLGASYNLKSVRLVWEAAYASRFQLQLSQDGQTFTTVYDGAAPGPGEQYVNIEGTGRYLRMQGVTPATQYGYSLYALEAWGTATTRNIASVTQPAALSAQKGTAFGSLTLPNTVNVTYEDGSTGSLPVSWSANGYDADAIGTVTLTGALTLPENVTNTSGLQARQTVTVLDRGTAVVLSQATLTLSETATATLTATVDPSLADKTVTWSSSNPAVASVNAAGTVSGIAVGTATVTASLPGGYSASCAVTVQALQAVLSQSTGYVTGIRPGTSAAQLMQNLLVGGAVPAGTQLAIQDAAGSPVTGTVGTGMKLKAGTDTYTVVVTGDIDGDGSVNSLDLLLLKRCILGLQPLSGAAAAAANIDRDAAANVNSTDLLKLKRYILGLDQINQV